MVQLDHATEKQQQWKTQYFTQANQRLVFQRNFFAPNLKYYAMVIMKKLQANTEIEIEFRKLEK